MDEYRMFILYILSVCLHLLFVQLMFQFYKSLFRHVPAPFGHRVPVPSFAKSLIPFGRCVLLPSFIAHVHCLPAPFSSLPVLHHLLSP